MAFEFKFPDVGEGIHEGKIVNWLVKEGDEVKADQSLAEIETDKAVVEIPSPKAGKIGKIEHAVGDTIKVGEVLVTIEQGAGEAGAPSEPKEKVTEEKRESTGVVGALEATAAGVLKAPSLEASGAVFGEQSAGQGESKAGAPSEPKEEETTKPATADKTKKAEPAAKKSEAKVAEKPILATRLAERFPGVVARMAQ